MTAPRTIPGPTADELAQLASQMRPEEWSRLCVSAEFLEAACESLPAAAGVASRLIGRDISVAARSETAEADL